MNREDLLGPTPPGQEGLSYTETNDSSGYKGVAIGAGVVALIGAKIIWGILGAAVADSPPSRAEQVASALQATAAAENLRAPQRLDEATTFVNAVASGNTLTFNHRVSEDIPAGELPSLRTEMQRQMRSDLCANQENRQIVSAGAVIVYRYTDTNGDLIETTVRSCLT